MTRKPNYCKAHGAAPGTHEACCPRPPQPVPPLSLTQRASTALAVMTCGASREACSARVSGKRPLMAQDEELSSGPHALAPGTWLSADTETAPCMEPSVSLGWAPCGDSGGQPASRRAWLVSAVVTRCTLVAAQAGPQEVVVRPASTCHQAPLQGAAALELSPEFAQPCLPKQGSPGMGPRGHSEWTSGQWLLGEMRSSKRRRKSSQGRRFPLCTFELFMQGQCKVELW